MWFRFGSGNEVTREIPTRGSQSIGESVALSPIIAPKMDECSTYTSKCLRKKALSMPGISSTERHFMKAARTQPPRPPPRIEHDVNKGLRKMAERVGLYPRCACATAETPNSTAASSRVADDHAMDLICGIFQEADPLVPPLRLLLPPFAASRNS